jgi:hypothetical protein
MLCTMARRCVERQKGKKKKKKGTLSIRSES